ncbi:MAG: phosphatidylglycerophosphatase A [Pyrinomonadaceae bacterium]
MRTIKDSSDELNPTAGATSDNFQSLQRIRSPIDSVALAIATCGVGYMPIAPGTWGSAIGVGVYLLFRVVSLRIFTSAESAGWSLTPLDAFRTTFILLILIALTIVGIWAATRAEPLLGRKDPGPVVIDEVVGQLITFVFVPLNIGMGGVMLGFLLFRFFDIWKPYPIRRLESLESGLGVVADDIVAGVYAATTMSLLTSLYLLF